MSNWLKKWFGRASGDFVEENQPPAKLSVEQAPYSEGPYEVYSDDNYDKEGNSQCHEGTYSSLEEAVLCCQRIVGDSVKRSTTYCNTPEEIVRNWRFGGATAFILGSKEFSADAYAEQTAKEVWRDLEKAQDDQL